MNVAAHRVRDRVERGLLPDVGEPLATVVDLTFLDDLLVAVVAAIGIEKKDAVVLECAPYALEVLLEQLAILQQPITEVHRRDDVRRLGDRLEDVFLQQRDTSPLRIIQFRQIVCASPVEDFAVEVDADRVPLLAAPDPFAAHIGGATEVFAQDLCLALAQLLECQIDEIDLGLGALHRVFVEFMSICLSGLAGGGFSSTPGVLFHPEVWSLAVSNADYTSKQPINPDVPWPGSGRQWDGAAVRKNSHLWRIQSWVLQRHSGSTWRAEA